MTPTWPRLAGWLQATDPPACRGRWRHLEDGAERTGTFVHRDGELAAHDDEGRLVRSGGPHDLLRRFDWSPPDYTYAVSVPEPVVHDGRPGWRVVLAPPPHKTGDLDVVVDAAWRVAVRYANAAHGFLVELTELREGPVEDTELAELRAAVAADEALRRLHELVHERPPPTPRWFPPRRSYAEADDVVMVDTGRGEGLVARVPLGAEPPTGEWPPEHVVRVDAHGWSWAVGSSEPITAAEAAAVVDAAVTGRPPAPD